MAPPVRFERLCYPRVSLPAVNLAGEPYAQGYQHGAALREQIGHNLAVYFDRFQREVQLGREEARARAARYQPRLDGGPYFDALKGMAAGSGHSVKWWRFCGHKAIPGPRSAWSISGTRFARRSSSRCIAHTRKAVSPKMLPSRSAKSTRRIR